MRFSGPFFSLLEQLTASAFTFLLFLVASRLLPSAELSLYTAYFSLSQSFSFFLMGLVLLPIATSHGSEVNRQLGISIFLLLMLLCAFALMSPLLMRLFGSFDGRISKLTVLLGIAFFATQCLYETARWLTIRLLGASFAVPITVIRVVLFFGAVGGLGAQHLDGFVFTLIQVIVNLIATVGYGLRLRPFFKGLAVTLPDRSALRHLSTFGNSLSSFVANLTVVTLIDRAWGGSGLSAFQVMRSATNPIGLIGQIVDNHYSAYLSRVNRKIAYSRLAVAISFALCVLIILVSFLIAPWATAKLLPMNFESWWLLFPIMLFASLAHVITRPVFVNWRLGRNTTALNLYSLTLVFVVVPGMVILWSIGEAFAMVTLFAAQPLASYLVLMYGPVERSKIKARQSK